MEEEKLLTLEMDLCAVAKSCDGRSGKDTISRMVSEGLFSKSK